MFVSISNTRTIWCRFKQIIILVPMSQVKNLYKSNKNNKENQKPLEKIKVQENGTKKAPKKVEKQQEPGKPKPPKSIESALNSVRHIYNFHI